MLVEGQLVAVRLLTPKEVGERLAVSVSMVYKLLRIGDLPAIRVGRLPRIAEDDLRAYVAHQREAGQ